MSQCGLTIWLWEHLRSSMCPCIYHTHRCDKYKIRKQRNVYISTDLLFSSGRVPHLKHTLDLLIMEQKWWRSCTYKRILAFWLRWIFPQQIFQQSGRKFVFRPFAQPCVFSASAVSLLDWPQKYIISGFFGFSSSISIESGKEPSWTFQDLIWGEPTTVKQQLQ